MGVDNKIAEAVECKDPMDTVLQSIDSLYLVRDTFFPLDPTIKKGRLDNLMRDLLVVLHDISSGLYCVSVLVLFPCGVSLLALG